MKRFQQLLIQYQSYKTYQIIKFTLLILIVICTIACSPEGNGGPGGFK
jgi:hypothetical protein